MLSNVTFETDCRLSTLGAFAFLGCSNLVSIRIPAGLREMTGRTFENSGVRTVIVDAENRHFKVLGNFLVDYHESCLVRYLGRDGRVDISETFESISPGCFSRCSSLRSVIFALGSKVATLGERTFAGCFALQAICIPASVETISEFCFFWCENLRSLTFESGCRISRLGKSAFDACYSLQSICIPASIEEIPSSCFMSCAFSTVAFESGCMIRSLGESAFSACMSLHSICLPSSIETISASCFAACQKLSDFTFAPGSKLLTLGEAAFRDCPSLRAIHLPSSIETISPRCFGNCEHLVSIVLEYRCKLSEESLSELRSNCTVSWN
jgi:hypothetical protein